MAKSEKKDIIVALNDSPGAWAALQTGLIMAKSEKSKLYLAYVYEVPRALPLETELPEELEKGDKILQKGMEICDEFDVESETLFLQGRNAGPVLVDEVEEKSGDMLLIGVNHAFRFGDFLFGSTVKYILSNANCRVIAVHPEARFGEAKTEKS